MMLISAATSYLPTATMKCNGQSRNRPHRYPLKFSPKPTGTAPIIPQFPTFWRDLLT